MVDGGAPGRRRQLPNPPAHPTPPYLYLAHLFLSLLSRFLPLSPQIIIFSAVVLLDDHPPVPLLCLTSVLSRSSSRLLCRPLNPIPFSVAPLLVYPNRYHGCSLRCLARYCLRYFHISLLVPLALANYLFLSRLCRFQVLISPTLTPLRPTLEPPATSASKLTTVTLQSDGIRPI
jgi:hypothetical protein